MQHENLICLVDWVGATMTTSDLQEVYKVLGIDEMEFIDGVRGMHGYTKQRICGGIRILYAGGPDMGTHIQFSGQGCREYETFYGGSMSKFHGPGHGDCWGDLFLRLLEKGATFSRTDFAVDEMRYKNARPYWTVNKLIKKAKAKELRTRFKRGKRIEDLIFTEEGDGGNTIYFGSDHSLIQFRVYEKGKEREAADKQLEEDLTTWNRFELQLADDRAQTAVEWLCKGLMAGELVFGIISNYLNFCDRTKDSNKARWPICEWWKDYLEEANKLKLAKRAPDKTIDSKESWLDRQTYPTFAEVWYAHGSPNVEEWAGEMLRNGLERMTDKQIERASEFRERMLREDNETKARKQVRYQERLQEREMENLTRREQGALRQAMIEVAAIKEKGTADTMPSYDPFA